MAAKIPAFIGLPANAPTDIYQVAQQNSWFAGTINNWIAIVAAYLTPGQYLGISTNTPALAGNVGEMISSQVLQASAISLSNNVTANLTSIPLTAGDWDVFGNANFTASGVTTFGFAVGLSKVSAFLPDKSLYTEVTSQGTAPDGVGLIAPSQPMSFASPTTVYLAVDAGFSSGTCVVSGFLWARRAR